MIVVPMIEWIGLLVLAVVVLRATWLVMHPATHHAALRPAHWSREVDRVLISHQVKHRA